MALTSLFRVRAKVTQFQIFGNYLQLNSYETLRMSEPVGSKAPAIQGEERSYMKRRGGVDIVVPCQGQGYPVPLFR